MMIGSSRFLHKTIDILTTLYVKRRGPFQRREFQNCILSSGLHGNVIESLRSSDDKTERCGTLETVASGDEILVQSHTPQLSNRLGLTTSQGQGEAQGGDIVNITY